MPQDQTLGLASLFQGPARYRARSPWGPWSALGITTLAVAAQLILFVIAVIVLASSAGLSEPEISTLMTELGSLKTHRGASFMIAAQLSTLIIIWIAAGRHGERERVLRLEGPHPSLPACLAAAALVAVVMGGFEWGLNRYAGADPLADSRWIAEGLREPHGWAIVVIAAVLAPIWEELAFRGFLLSALARTRLGFWPSALVTTLLWTGLHASYSPQGLAVVFLAGMLLSWLMWRWGSMRAVIIVHGLANAVALGAIYWLTR